ncbi:MAG: response regulator [Deltaproteobacteria bacterium]|nr:response regulator [Deltaproteobacteria bacterium]
MQDRASLQALFEVRFDQGVELFGAGDPADKIFVVTSGAVEIVQRVYGVEKRVGVARPGDPVGEMALLPDRHHVVSARAIEPTRALALPAESCLEMLAQAPEIGLGMLKKLAERLANAHDQLWTLLGRESVSRVTQTLAMLADTQGAPPTEDGYRVLRVRNEALAALARINVPTLLDVLAGLADRGLIRRQNFGTLAVAPRGSLDEFVDELVQIRRRTRVLLVDDSSLFRRVLKNALEGMAEVEIAGVATNGAEAVTMVRALRPDVVIMDVQMPVMNGIEATREIMAEHPTPILVMTSLADSDDGSLTFEALRAGAIALWPKPVQMPVKPADAMRLGEELRRMAQIDVARVSLPIAAQQGSFETSGRPAKRVGIVAEAGGPQALTWLLAHLPADFPGQILLAQSLAAPHHRTLAEWLDRNGRLRSSLACAGESFRPGTVIVGPPDQNLIVGPEGRLTLEPFRRDKLPGDALLESLAVSEGASSVGVILSGAGADGSEGLRFLRDAGGLAFVQHPGDAVVDVMPRAALRAVPEARVFALSELPSLLVQLTTGRSK